MFSASQYVPSRTSATVISPLATRRLSPALARRTSLALQGPACTAAQGRSSLSRSSVLPPSGRAAGRPPRVWYASRRARRPEAVRPWTGPGRSADRPAPLLRPTRGPHPGASLRRGCEATSQLQSRSRSAGAKRALGAHVLLAIGFVRIRTSKPATHMWFPRPVGAGSGPCSASKSRLDDGKGIQVRGRASARSWVAITDVRRSAPPGGTAGCSAVLTKTPAS